VDCGPDRGGSLMSRALTFKEEEAIRRAGVVEIVCSEVPERTFRLTAEEMRRRGDEHDLVFLIRALIEEGAVLPGFVEPNKFLPNIVMRAAPDIRERLARAMHRDENK
jgi:hypothetical protein